MPTIEFLEDRVRVTYYLRKPFGIPDIMRKIEVLYSDIKDLPFAPETVGHGSTSKRLGDEIFVPRINERILFIVDRWQETCSGPLEEEVHGPYRCSETCALSLP